MKKDQRELIIQLEKETRVMEPQGLELEKLTKQITSYAHEYLNNVGEINAYSPGYSSDNQLLKTPFGEDGKALERLIDIIQKDVDTPGINPASGKHLGYIPGGGIYPTAMGDFLAAVVNKYSGIFYASPGAVQMENMVIRWIATMLGFPQGTLGNLTSGGSIANLIGIVTARDSQGINSDKISKSCIYLTEQAHHSVQKAIRIAGLADAHLRYIKITSAYKMDVTHLREQIQADKANDLIPFLVIGSAGTTDTGAIDPLNEIADICEQHKLWFHVDAAYGGFFMLVDELKNKFNGISRADSLTIDPHKGLFLSYGLGVVIVRDLDALRETHHYQANYMQDAIGLLEEPSPADLSPELTKHFRGLRIWLPLQLFGVSVFRKALHEKHLLCSYFYQRVQEIGFEVGSNPELSVCVYRYTQGINNPDEFNQKLINRIQSDGEIFISSTKIEGKFWLRLAVLVFRTHLLTIDRLLVILSETRDELLKLKE